MTKEGYKQTKEHKNKISAGLKEAHNKNNFGFEIGHESFHTEESNKKTSDTLLGHEVSEDLKKKISKALIKKHEEVKFGFPPGHESRKGQKNTEEHCKKIKESLVGHHIWYEDNEGKLTDKGVMFVVRAHHNEIHGVLNKNKWTDNRRYLAG